MRSAFILLGGLLFAGPAAAAFVEVVPLDSSLMRFEAFIVLTEAIPSIATVDVDLVLDPAPFVHDLENGRLTRFGVTSHSRFVSLDKSNSAFAGHTFGPTGSIWHDGEALFLSGSALGGTSGGELPGNGQFLGPFEPGDRFAIGRFETDQPATQIFIATGRVHLYAVLRPDQRPLSMSSLPGDNVLRLNDVASSQGLVPEPSAALLALLGIAALGVYRRLDCSPWLSGRMPGDC